MASPVSTLPIFSVQLARGNCFLLSYLFHWTVTFLFPNSMCILLLLHFLTVDINFLLQTGISFSEPIFSIELLSYFSATLHGYVNIVFKFPKCHNTFHLFILFLFCFFCFSKWPLLSDCPFPGDLLLAPSVLWMRHLFPVLGGLMCCFPCVPGAWYSYYFSGTAQLLKKEIWKINFWNPNMSGNVLFWLSRLIQFDWILHSKSKIMISDF